MIRAEVVISLLVGGFLLHPRLRDLSGHDYSWRSVSRARSQRSVL